MTDTERLYYTDARLLTFTARVVERAEEGKRIYLDRTAFYPTSGGQPHDLGILGEVPIADVIDEGRRIAHLLAAPLPADQEEVAGVVDAERRRDHMEQHTGQHLLSALLHERFGWRTLSVHFGTDLCTVDVDAAPEKVTGAALAAAEEECNRIVLEDRIVAVSFEESGAASGLRKASEREGMLRVVTIEGVDRSACGGTHVRTTGEIGPVLLRRAERVKQGTRIEFLCGLRAVKRARRDQEALTSAARTLSVSIDELPAAVEALREQLRESDRRRRALEAESAAMHARALYDATAADARGLRRCLDRRLAPAGESKGVVEVMRARALAYVMFERAFFVGVVDSEDSRDLSSLVVASSDDAGVDAGGALRDALAVVGGRGGGSARLAQGSAPTARVNEVLAALGVMHLAPPTLSHPDVSHSSNTGEESASRATLDR